jgi:hypothetical protein
MRSAQWQLSGRSPARPLLAQNVGKLKARSDFKGGQCPARACKSE